jgi:hypothetical protein
METFLAFRPVILRSCELENIGFNILRACDIGWFSHLSSLPTFTWRSNNIEGSVQENKLRLNPY